MAWKLVQRVMRNLETVHEAPHIMNFKQTGGLPYVALSSSGESICPWVVMRLSQGIFFFGGHFLDFDTIGSPLFVRASRYVTHPCCGQGGATLINSPVTWRSQLIHVGSSSITVGNKVTEEDSREELFSLVYKLVRIDEKTGKGVPWPAEFQNKYKPLCQGGKSLFPEEVNREKGTGVFGTKAVVKLSDVDIFQHTSHAVYAQEAVNTISRGIAERHLTGVTREQMNNIKQIDCAYERPTKEGDELDIEVWQDSKNQFSFNVTNTNEASTACTGSIVFSLPQN